MEMTEIVFIVLLMAVAFMLAFHSYLELRKTNEKRNAAKREIDTSENISDEFYPIAPRKVTKEELQNTENFPESMFAGKVA